MDIRLEGVSLCYDKLTVFNSLSINFKPESITAVLGPSGCGKTSLLNIISGVVNPKNGRVVKNNNGKMSYLFQEPRLIPWKTAGENIDFVLKNAYPTPERNKVLNHYLSLVKLGFFKNYYPDQLSGGMRQRLAIARAFAFPSSILLMDEPFQALDLSLKISMMKTFKKLWIKTPKTTIFVTHDVSEALLLGDRIIVLNHAPGGIVRELTNPLPLEERTPGNKGILAMESELISTLLSLKYPKDPNPLQPM